MTFSQSLALINNLASMTQILSKVEHFFIFLSIYLGFVEKSITGLEIINGYFNNQIDTNKDNLEEWIDLDGTRTVWLKINFNQKYIPPITHLEFLYMAQEGEYLVI